MGQYFQISINYDIPLFRLYFVISKPKPNSIDFQDFAKSRNQKAAGL